MIASLFLTALALQPASAETGAGAHGFWIGNLRLCGERVTSVRMDDSGGLPGLTFRFSKDFAPRVEALSRTRLGAPLAMTLDGKVVSSPVVREPLTSGASVGPVDGIPIARIRRAVATAC